MTFIQKYNKQDFYILKYKNIMFCKEKINGYCKNKLIYDQIKNNNQKYKLLNYVFSKNIYFIIFYFWFLISFLILLKFIYFNKYKDFFMSHVSNFSDLKSLFSNGALNMDIDNNF